MGMIEQIPEHGIYLGQHKQHESHRFAVIKVGGGIIADFDQCVATANALSEMHSHGLYPVVIHGAGTFINEALAERGIVSEYDKHDHRITPREHMPIIEDQLADANMVLTEALSWRGLRSDGIKSIFAAELSDPQNLASVTKITDVYTEPITETIGRKELAIISSLGRLAAERYQAVNINADVAALALVKALRPHKFVLLTPEGAINDAGGQPISKLTDIELEALIFSGVVKGGMKVKSINCIKALDYVDQALITSPEHLIKEFFSHKGDGTMIVKADR